MSAHHPTTDDRGVGYGRMSTDMQEASIPEQLDWAKRTAAADGVDLVKCFQDEGIPGSEVERRTGLWELVAFCQHPPGGKPITVLYLWDGDRFSRADSISTAAVLYPLMQAGVTRLRTPDGWVDLCSAMDRIMFFLQQDLSREGFSKSLSKNVARSGLRRALEGMWVAGRPPYGYVKGPDGHLLPGDSDKVELVQWAFRQYADTADSLGDLARRLNDQGVPPPRDRDGKGRWRRDYMYSLLTNKAYRGDIVWNTTHQGKYSRITGGEVEPIADRRKQRGAKNDPADIVACRDAHPPLVDRDTFNRAARKLASRRWKGTTPIPGGGEWVLSGMVRCGDCGSTMYGRRVNPRRGSQQLVTYRYFCSANAQHGKGSCRNSSIPQDELLEAVAHEVRNSFNDPAQLEALTAKLVKKAQKAEEDQAGKIRALESRLAKLDADIAHGKGNLLLIPPDLMAGAAATLREWQDERARLALERDQLAQAVAEDETAAAEVVQALKELTALGEALTTEPAPVVRNLMRKLVQRVTVIFDHGRPHNRCHAVEVEVVMTPEAAYLLPSGLTPQQVCIELRCPVQVA